MGIFRKKDGPYEDKDFRLVLPQGWTRSGGRPGDLIVFADGSGDRQLSVGMHVLRDRDPNLDDVRASARDVYRVRLIEERKHLHSGDPLEEPGVDETASEPHGIYWGKQNETGRLFAGYVRAKGRRTVVAYLESYIGNSDENVDLLKQIVDELELK